MESGVETEFHNKIANFCICAKESMKPVGKMQGFVNANTPVTACDKFKKKSKLTKKCQAAQAKSMGRCGCQGGAQRPQAAAPQKPLAAPAAPAS